jgi:predicted short-subunit dehydrogenase-like oxidoreductase (DUF2520 family)
MFSHALPNIHFIGGGRTGASLAFYFLRQGLAINSLVEKNPDRLHFLKKEFQWNFLDHHLVPQRLSDAAVVFITVRDDHISELTGTLSKLKINWKNKLVLHCSGTLSSRVLDPLQEKGAGTASFHPIYSFALDPRENRLLNEVWFNIEGESEVLNRLEEIFAFKKEKFIRINAEQKQALHLACVFYSNFYIALAKMSHDLIKNFPIPEKEVFQIFHPLLQSSVEQVLQHGLTAALTGPITRADQKTIATHLDYLREHHSDLLPVYVTFSQELISITNLSAKDKTDLIRLFQNYKIHF